MKAKMRGKIIGCSTEQNQVTITVINLGDKRSQASAANKELAVVPTPLVVRGIAVRKLAEFSQLLSEENEIVVSLQLTGNLSTVTDILSAKVNGIEIDLSQIDAQEERRKAQKQRQKQAEDNTLRVIVQITAALLVAAVLLSVISNFH